MSKFQVGDRVRLLDDFDDVKSGKLGIVKDAGTEDLAPFEVKVDFNSSEGPLLLHDEEVEFVSHAPGSLDDVSNEEWNQAQPRIATLPEEFKPNHLFGEPYTMEERANAVTAVFSSDLNNVAQPAHYTSHPSGIETIEITKHESFLRGNLLKYVLRAPYKGAELEDLLKAQQYLEWEIARVEAGKK